MKMNKIIILFLLKFHVCYALWELEWHDEFNSKVLDQNKWEIDVQDSNQCDNENIGRLNCFTNSTRNVRTINGTLALTAIYEKTLNKYSTSAWIRSAVNFTYGRIDIRAALPRGQLLSPWVKLVSPRYKNKDGFAKSNQLTVFFNDQSSKVRYGVSLGKKYFGHLEDYNTTENLANFHTYSLEWSKNELIWKFDDHMINKIDVSNIETFMNDPVILSIYLRVGGQPFGKQELTIEQASNWTCSSLILDYVRYYKWTQDDQAKISQTEQDRDPIGFCPGLMDEISRINKKIINSTESIIATFVPVVICLIIVKIIT